MLLFFRKTFFSFLRIKKVFLEIIKKICATARQKKWGCKIPQSFSNEITKRYITNSICFNAAKMSNEIKAKAISTLTNSGYTAYQISAWRPNAHILVFSSNKKI